MVRRPPLSTRTDTLFPYTTLFLTLDDTKFATCNMTEAVLVEEDKLVKAIEAAIQAGESQRMDLGDSDLENLEVEGGEADANVDVSKADADDAPLVRYVNKVLGEAINLRSEERRVGKECVRKCRSRRAPVH